MSDTDPVTFVSASPVAAPTLTEGPGPVTSTALGEAADAATAAANVVQAKAHGDSAGVASAETVFVQSVMAFGETEVLAFLERMLKLEAKAGVGGIAGAIESVFTRIGGIL